MDDLNSFLGLDETVPFMFSDRGDKGTEIDDVRSAFIRIIQENENYPTQMQLKCPYIIALDQLFYEIQLKAAKKYQKNQRFGSIEDARKELNKNSDIYKDAGCEFHKAKDASLYCSYAR